MLDSNGAEGHGEMLGPGTLKRKRLLTMRFVLCFSWNACSISRERAFGFIILRIRMLCDSGELWRVRNETI